MKLKKFSAAVLAFTILFSLGALVVSAQTPGQTPTGGAPGQTQTHDQSLKFTLNNPLKTEYGNDIPSFLQGLLNKVILPLAEVIIVFMFIFTGFKFVTAQGKPKEIEDAKNSLLYLAIGTAILLGAWGLSLIIKNTVNQVIQS